MLELLGVGRDADVFALDDDRVLRRYRDGSDGDRDEADLMRYVGGFGFPVPEGCTTPTGRTWCWNGCGGPTLLDALLGPGSVDAATGGRLAVELRRQPAAQIPPRSSPDDRILHLDLHPQNVMVEPRGPGTDRLAERDRGPGRAGTSRCPRSSSPRSRSIRSARTPPIAGELLERFAAGHEAGWLDQAVARRGADPNLTTAERDQLAEAESLARQLLLGTH